MRRKDAAPLSSILDAFLESLRIPHVAFLVALRKRWPRPPKAAPYSWWMRGRRGCGSTGASRG